MHDGYRVIRMQRDRTEADGEGPAVRQVSFLVREKLLVVGQHERRIGGQSRLPDILSASLERNERRAETVERLLERRDRAVHTGRDFVLHPGGGDERPSDQRGVRTDIRVGRIQTEADKTNKPRGSGRAEKQQADLSVPANVVSEEESRVCRVEQDVHPTCASGQVVEGEIRIRGRPMAHHEEAAHSWPNGPRPLRIRSNGLYLLFVMNNSI